MKSMTFPSLVPFLVSTLRPFKLKLRSMILLTLTISSFSASSSMESITQPYLEYSRIDLASRMLVFLTRGPETKKATIFKESGSTMGVAIVAT